MLAQALMQVNDCQWLVTASGHAQDDSMTDCALTLRLATEQDAETLYRWDTKPHVQASASTSGTVSFEADWEEELEPRDDGTEFYIAEISDVAIGALQIIDPATEESHYWGPVASDLRAVDIWIGEEDYLGRGYGTQMMTFAIERCFQPPAVRMIIIDPLANNVRAHQFYERLGFEFAGNRVFDEESVCRLYELTRVCWYSHRISAVKNS